MASSNIGQLHMIDDRANNRSNTQWTQDEFTTLVGNCRNCWRHGRRDGSLPIAQPRKDALGSGAPCRGDQSPVRSLQHSRPIPTNSCDNTFRRCNRNAPAPVGPYLASRRYCVLLWITVLLRIALRNHIHGRFRIREDRTDWRHFIHRRLDNSGCRRILVRANRT